MIEDKEFARKFLQMYDAFVSIYGLDGTSWIDFINFLKRETQ